MGNFFEVLGMANIERMHSQMWLYFFQDGFLDNKQKSDILNDLFGTTGAYKSFRCYTEYKNIDVLIIVDENKIFAIENKVKIGQHDNQLEKYYKNLKADFKVAPHCVYLSLIGEDSLSQNWLSKKYKDLLNTLQKLYFENPKNFQEQIFDEYVDSLKRLIGIFEEFSNDHKEFCQVFWDGSKKKDEKSKLLEDYTYYETDSQRYIAFNNLETIFQKSFLLKIAKELNSNLDLDSEKLPKAHIDESRGSALLHIDIREGDDKDFLWGIQFQSETVKITYSKKDYPHSLKSELGVQNIEKLKKFGVENTLKFNPPKTKAYMSLSKKFGDKNLWKKDFDFLSKLYKKEYESNKKLIGEISF